MMRNWVISRDGVIVAQVLAEVSPAEQFCGIDTTGCLVRATDEPVDDPFLIVTEGGDFEEDCDKFDDYARQRIDEKYELRNPASPALSAEYEHKYKLAKDFVDNGTPSDLLSAEADRMQITVLQLANSIISNYTAEKERLEGEALSRRLAVLDVVDAPTLAQKKIALQAYLES